MRNQYQLRMHWRLCFFFLGLLFTSQVQGQIQVEGLVRDVHLDPVPYASVYVQTIDTSTVIAYAYTDAEGHFSINTEEKGPHLLVVKMLGYDTYYRELDLNTSTPHLSFKISLLNMGEYEMETVDIVSEGPPIVFKKDTIIFDASAFGNGTERSIEDLLRKIPGIDVADNGSISVKGKTVETVMIEGDNLFEKGYMILTKNLSAEMVDKVEVLEHYSENEIIKEVEDSDKVALNLTLDEERKAVLFGNAEPAYGTDGYYNSKLNLISLLGKSKFYSFTSLNNIGESGESGALDAAYQDAESDLSTFGFESEYGVTLVPMRPNVVAERGNFNNEEFSSLSFVSPLSKKLKLKGQVAYLSDEVDFFENTSEEYLLPDESFFLSEDYRLRERKTSMLGNLNLTYHAHDNHLIEYESNYQVNQINTSADLLFNKNNLAESLQNDLKQFKQTLTYTQKLGEGEVFTFTSKYFFDQKPQLYRANQFQFRSLFPDAGSASNISQISDFQTDFLGFNAKYIKNSGKNNLQFNVNWITRSSLFSNEILADEEGQQGLSNQILKNILSYEQEVWSAHTMWTHNFTPNLSLNTGLEANYGKINAALEENPEAFAPAERYFLSPKLGFKWNINQDNLINFRYTYGSEPLTIREYFPGYSIVNYRSINVGLGELRWMNKSNVLASYSFGSWSDKFFAKASLIFAKNHNYIGSRTVIQPEYFLYSNLALDEQEYLSVNVSVDRFIKFLSSNLKLISNFSSSKYQNYLNESELRDVYMRNWQVGFEGRSVTDLFFAVHLGSSWRLATYESNLTITNQTNESFFDLTLFPAKQWNIEWNNVYYHFGNLAKGNNSFYFTDLKARFTPKEKDWDLGISLNNVLNTRWYSNVNISDYQRSSSSYRLLPRYLLLDATFRLAPFGNKK